MRDRYLSITAITRYLKAKFDNDQNLRVIFLKGEISNFKSHTTGHMYFSLKDENSKINAIMFRSSAKNLNFTPQDGSKVLVRGRISVYEATGSYQIYVDEMQEDGIGNLYIEFEKLKKKLAREGLFDKSHKKPIPKYPQRIGVITAPTGAAIRDILTTIKRRYPICEVLLFPTLVQGVNAKDDIVKNIQRAQDYNIDTLIVGRGGGSIEDLWPFNEEIVARAIYNSKIPVISGVGHEIDFTISDFVADLRAPTPTAAAELAVPNLSDLKTMLKQYSIRLNEAIKKKVNLERLKLDAIKSSYVIKTPMIMYENKKEKLDLISTKLTEIITNNIKKYQEKINNYKNSYVLNNPKMFYENKQKELKNDQDKVNDLMKRIIQNKKDNLKYIINSLDLLNPLKVLERGYSITYSDKKIVKSINDVKDKIKVKLTDGTIYGKVTRKVQE